MFLLMYGNRWMFFLFLCHIYSNSGQCVLTMRSFSALNPSFDLSLCRARLESNGFQVSGCNYIPINCYAANGEHIIILFSRSPSRTWRSHWRPLWMFQPSGVTWFSTRLCSILFWRQYVCLVFLFDGFTFQGRGGQLFCPKSHIGFQVLTNEPVNWSN